MEKIKVELATAKLTAGIPRKGPLMTSQIKEWLAREGIHDEIAPVLPYGLSAAQASVLIPGENPMTKAKKELGRALFFDTRLSSDNTIACSSRHHPDDDFRRWGQATGGWSQLAG